MNLLYGVPGVVLQASAPHLRTLLLKDAQGQVERHRRRQRGGQGHQAVVQ